MNRIKLRNNREIINIFLWLRFPMIVFVVLIHANLSDVTIQGLSICNNFPQSYFAFMYFFSEAMTRLAVPVFFIISGYLFFYKVDSFGKEEYIGKLKRRVLSLLLPYLLWNLIGYIYVILKGIFFPSIFPSLTKESLGIDFLLNGLWSMGEGKCPLLYQLWYIRDLIVVVLLSPLIYIFIKKMKFMALVILFILWFLPIDLPTGLGATSFFYFSVGAYLNISGGMINSGGKVTLITFPILYVVFILMDTYWRDSTYDWIFHKLAIIFGIVTMFVLFNRINGRFKLNKFFPECTFFIFCFHVFILDISKILIKLTKADTSHEMILIYFVTVIAVIVISMIIYKFLSKYFIRLLNILMGGR